MRYTVNLTSKGQMMLSKAARDEIGVKPRDMVMVEIEQGQVKVKKSPDLSDVWKLTATSKRWPGDRAADQVMAAAKKVDYGQGSQRRS